MTVSRFGFSFIGCGNCQLHPLLSHSEHGFTHVSVWRLSCQLDAFFSETVILLGGRHSLSLSHASAGVSHIANTALMWPSVEYAPVCGILASVHPDGKPDGGRRADEPQSRGSRGTLTIQVIDLPPAQYDHVPAADA